MLLRQRVTEEIARKLYLLATAPFLATAPKWLELEEEVRSIWWNEATAVVDELAAHTLAEIKDGVEAAAKSLWSRGFSGVTTPDEWDKMPAYARNKFRLDVMAVLEGWIAPGVLKRFDIQLEDEYIYIPEGRGTE